MLEILYTCFAFVSAGWVLFQSRHYLSNGKAELPGLPDNGVPLPLVSIIVPARNEAKALPTLLESLGKLVYPNYEIIVVDDHSSDKTAQWVERQQYPVKLIKAPPKPEGWVGKNWACHLGAQAAQGGLLLFTDADTVHRPQSLNLALAQVKQTGACMLSAPSFHRNQRWWEKLLAPFYFIIHASASPYQAAKPGNAYAIGQYLLFSAPFYSQIGGHAAVKGSLSEDAALAKLTLSKGAHFEMYTAATLYEVQMFEGFWEFVRGWIRLLRLGMQHLSASSVITSLLTLCALTSINVSRIDVDWLPTLLVLFCIAVSQRHFGRFPLWGLVFFPFSVLLFIVLASYAGICQLLKRPMTWQGRSYLPQAYETIPSK